MGTKLNYVGHSCFCINNDGTLILIDPFLTHNPKAKVTFDLKKVKYIFVTHAHSDHLGDAIEISKRTGAPIVAVFELANYCRTKGANTIGAGIGGSVERFAIKEYEKMKKILFGFLATMLTLSVVALTTVAAPSHGHGGGGCHGGSHSSISYHIKSKKPYKGYIWKLM